jgi:hypothetical protein
MSEPTAKGWSRSSRGDYENRFDVVPNLTDYPQVVHTAVLFRLTFSLARRRPSLQNGNCDRGGDFPVRRFGGGSSNWFKVTETVWPARAERAIHAALLTFETKHPTADQLCDLADAIDAYGDRSFYVATVLAEGSVHRRVMEQGRRPKLNRTLSDLMASFVEQRRRARAFSGDDLT